MQKAGIFWQQYCSFDEIWVGVFFSALVDIISFPWKTQGQSYFVEEWTRTLIINFEFITHSSRRPRTKFYLAIDFDDMFLSYIKRLYAFVS